MNIIIYCFMWKNMSKKIIVGMLSITPFILITGCNNGSVESASNNSVTTIAEDFNSANMLTNVESSAIDINGSCLKVVLNQTQSANKLNSTLTFNNTCNYDTFIGGYKINLTSEYTDSSAAKLDQLSYAYVNENGSNRTYSLNLLPQRYACLGSNGVFENLTGVLDARKIKAGGSLILNNVTTLASGKTYNLKLAKASFRFLSPTDLVQNELGLSLSDPESFNYFNSESNSNKGNDSLRNIPFKQYGLKTVMITNHSCGDVSEVFPTIVLPTKVTLDRVRTTCKVDGTQGLLSKQSCNLVLRYDPRADDAVQAYESQVNIDAYAQDVVSHLPKQSNIFKVAYSTRGKVSGVQTIYNQLSVVDNQPNGLKNISINGFGFKTYTIKNNADKAIESLSFVYAPTSLGLPRGLEYDASRTSCKLDGSQVLSAGQSCNLTIKYTSKIQQIEESAIFQAVGYLANSNKAVAYASLKYLLAYSTSLNNTPSIIPTTTGFINGFDVDANVTGLGFNSSISNIQAGSFGLKAYLVVNNTGQNMYNVNIDNINVLNSLATLKIDETRSSCKFNTASTYNKFSLKDGQSCLLVFKYAPTLANKANVSYNLTLSGYDAGGSKVVSDVTLMQATSK